MLSWTQTRDTGEASEASQTSYSFSGCPSSMGQPEMTQIDGGLRVIFRQYIPTFMWTSIETGGTARGIPDSNFLAPNGIEGWVEYKITKAFAVTMRPEQIGWIDRRNRLGGRIWIAVRQIRKDGDFLHLVPGHQVKELATDGLRFIGDECFIWEGGPPRWNWRSIQATLTTRDTSHR